MLSHRNPTKTEIPRQINASVLLPPISPLRMQRRMRDPFLRAFLNECTKGSPPKQAPKAINYPITGEMVTLATLSYFSSTVTTPSTGVTVVEVEVPSAAVTVTV